jgi:catalase
VKTLAIRERMVGMITRVDKTLAEKVAEGLGTQVPQPAENLNQNIPADGDPAKFQPVDVHPDLKISKALSMEGTAKNTIKTRQVAILAADGVNGELLDAVKQTLEDAGAQTMIVAPHLGFITATNGTQIKVDKSFITTASVLFDAVYIADGAKSAALLQEEPDAVHFVNEAYKHCKAIAANGAGAKLIEISAVGVKLQNEGQKGEKITEAGVLTDCIPNDFIKAIAQHRFWEREKPGKVPA